MSLIDSDRKYENIRILVLEDEVYIRQIICRLLREIGFQLIDEAANGADGFKELLRVQPAVILCDIHMEPVDGLTFVRKLRNLGHPELSKIPVVFLTADTQEGTIVEARELRINGYLAKPVSQKALKDRLDSVLFAKTE